MAKTKKLTRAEQKQLRPIQILDAAFEEFVAKGYSTARVEDIAERIGVTKGTIYVYFPTKEDLFSAMIGHISAPLQDLLVESRELTGSSAEKLRAMLLLAYDKITRDRQTRELMRFVISEGARFPQLIDQHHTELVEPLIGNTQQILDEGMAKGEFRKSPTVNAEIIVAPMLTLLIDLLIFDNRRTVDLPAYITAHLDLVLNGIVAKPG